MVYQQPLTQIDIDVLVCAETQQSFDELVALCVGVPGVRLWNAGDLATSAVVESMTTVLLNLNRRSNSTLGFAVTSLTQPPAIKLTGVALAPGSTVSH
jgi:predicted dinucleotide-binding enzyme